MKKKIMALVCAAVLTMGSSMTVFAEGSPSVGTTDQPVETQEATATVAQSDTAAGYAAKCQVSGGFTLTKTSDTTVQAAGVATQNIVLNDLAATGNVLGRADLVAAASDPNAIVTGYVATCADIKPSSAVKDAEGYYNFVLGVPGIAAGDIVVGLHYNDATKSWNALVPTAVADNAVALRSKDCSPFVVVKIVIQSVQQEIPAPSTGETLPYATMAVILIGATGAVIFGRKYLQLKQK